jgi:hypothetical protein
LEIVATIPELLLPNNVLLKEKDLYKVSVTSSVYFSPVVE